MVATAQSPRGPRPAGACSTASVQPDRNVLEHRPTKNHIACATNHPPTTTEANVYAEVAGVGDQ